MMRIYKNNHTQHIYVFSCLVLNHHFRSVTAVRNQVFVEAFGANLKKIRIKKGMSQEALAYEADLPINQVGRIERGEINTTISTVYALAQALEVTPADLMKFKLD
jgi:DNA-binding XRE family transcriptional regulator